MEELKSSLSLVCSDPVNLIVLPKQITGNWVSDELEVIVCEPRKPCERDYELSESRDAARLGRRTSTDPSATQKKKKKKKKTIGSNNSRVNEGTDVVLKAARTALSPEKVEICPNAGIQNGRSEIHPLVQRQDDVVNEAGLCDIIAAHTPKKVGRDNDFPAHMAEEDSKPVFKDYCLSDKLFRSDDVVNEAALCDVIAVHTPNKLGCDNDFPAHVAKEDSKLVFKDYCLSDELYRCDDVNEAALCDVIAVHTPNKVGHDNDIPAHVAEEDSKPVFKDYCLSDELFRCDDVVNETALCDVIAVHTPNKVGHDNDIPAHAAEENSKPVFKDYCLSDELFGTCGETSENSRNEMVLTVSPGGATPANGDNMAATRIQTILANSNSAGANIVQATSHSSHCEEVQTIFNDTDNVNVDKVEGIIAESSNVDMSRVQAIPTKNDHKDANKIQTMRNCSNCAEIRAMHNNGDDINEDNLCTGSQTDLMNDYCQRWLRSNVSDTGIADHVPATTVTDTTSSTSYTTAASFTDPVSTTTRMSAAHAATDQNWMAPPSSLHVFVDPAVACNIWKHHLNFIKRHIRHFKFESENDHIS